MASHWRVAGDGVHIKWRAKQAKDEENSQGEHEPSAARRRRGRFRHRLSTAALGHGLPQIHLHLGPGMDTLARAVVGVDHGGRSDPAEAQ